MCRIIIKECIYVCILMDYLISIILPCLMQSELSETKRAQQDLQKDKSSLKLDSEYKDVSENKLL